MCMIVGPAPRRARKLNIVIDEIGPGEGRLDSRGIEIPLKPAGKGGVAQFPAGSPVQATTWPARRAAAGAFAETATALYVSNFRQ